MSTATLTVIRGAQAGHVYPLDPAKVTTLGRLENCDIVLSDVAVSGGPVALNAGVNAISVESGISERLKVTFRTEGAVEFVI